MALYDSIAGIYDPWSASVVEDIAFYVEEALGCDGPVVELAVGSGRIAVPIAQAGRAVIGVDLSEGMLAVARALAEEHGVGALVDLRVGDLREPPVDERVPLVICPFRSLLHMPDEEREAAGTAGRPRAARARRPPRLRRLRPEQRGHRRDARHLARARGRHLRAGRLGRGVEDAAGCRCGRATRAASMELHWLSAIEWRRLIDEAGFDVAGLYGWFDRRPYRGDEDMIWACRRRD